MATTPWDQLKAWFTAKLPDNDQEKITPKDLRDVLGEVMDSFEKMLYYLVTAPELRAITIYDKTARSWPVVLKSASNTIGFMAITTVTKRTLVLDKTFKVTGAGVNRNLIITDPYFDDFAPGDELVWVENVKGGEIKFQVPQIGIQQVNGEEKYVWQYPDEPDSLTVIAGVNFDPRKVTVVVNASNGILVEHPLNSTNLRIDVLTPENRPVSFVSAFPVDATHVRLEMPEGEMFPVKLLISAYPQSQ
ncbi:hypothetical protein BWI96_18955 [Siphonobacter sp. SORGH_AS_0500]|uniref:hypothetical protein n=1 Tax=Siphonobacter sp. SORGH_AS_0500 TaxID=1864824 RepID=UPI000CB07497|nr:hypothetical protein [Siphonobacter sp. SORGH_AS_0500]PKK35134.1 hypothetical protein BWI96_18955 [Siphonobacter sp. SORGH_AS_0500]